MSLIILLLMAIAYFIFYLVVKTDAKHNFINKKGWTISFIAACVTIPVASLLLSMIYVSSKKAELYQHNFAQDNAEANQRRASMLPRLARLKPSGKVKKSPYAWNAEHEVRRNRGDTFDTDIADKYNVRNRKIRFASSA